MHSSFSISQGGFAVRELVQHGVSPDIARKAPHLLHFHRRASAPDEKIFMSFLESGHDQDLARAILEKEQEEIAEMTSTLAELGIEFDIASRAANTVATAFESYRTGCALPASAGLEYCRDMAILLQAVLIHGAQVKCTNGLSWFNLDLKQTSKFDSTLVESLDPILAARRQAVLTRGHSTTTTTSKIRSLSSAYSTGRIKPQRKAAPLTIDTAEEKQRP
jgi:hypothetical protein